MILDWEVIKEKLVDPTRADFDRHEREFIIKFAAEIHKMIADMFKELNIPKEH